MDGWTAKIDFEIEPRAATLLRLDLSINEQHFTRTASARAQLVNVAEGIRLDSHSGLHTRDERALTAEVKVHPLDP